MIVALFKKYYGLFKFIVSGGSAAFVNLGVLYMLTEYAGVHYLQSAVLSFACAFFVSFLLQKFWTFSNTAKEQMHLQMVAYLAVSLMNLGINTLIIFLLVEVAHLWYIIAAIIAGVLLAIESFFIYRHVIFSHGGHPLLVWLDKNVSRFDYKALILAFFLLAAFLATYKLTESPPTWLDEGAIVQVASNVLRHGPLMSIQTAPGVFEQASYVTTSFPVTYPVALSFFIFGTGLLQARAVMACFILCFLLAAHLLLKRESARPLPLLGLTLLATFAPLYGNGKNVLGEIPGLLFLFLSLYFVRRIESGRRNIFEYIGLGVFFGLMVSTKPIFILAIVPAAIVFFFSLRLFDLKRASVTILGFAAVAASWFVIQFGTGDWKKEFLSHYVNPYQTDTLTNVLHNAIGFVTHIETLYALALLAAWVCAVAWRLYRGAHISRGEWMAFGFSLLVYLAYLRTPEFYRYFFLGEVCALAFLPLSLASLWPRKLPLWLLYAALGLLASFQLYQCFYGSWIAEHYSSTRSAQLSSLTSGLSNKTVFVYQAPEAVLFLPADASYYQYIKFNDQFIVGPQSVPVIAQGVPDAVIIPSQNVAEVDLSKYRLAETDDRYELWLKR